MSITIPPERRLLSRYRLYSVDGPAFGWISALLRLTVDSPVDSRQSSFLVLKGTFSLELFRIVYHIERINHIRHIGHISILMTYCDLCAYCGEKTLKIENCKLSYFCMTN